MDFEEILAYKPSGTSSPPPMNKGKRRKLTEEDQEEDHHDDAEGISSAERDRILAMIEAEPEPEPFTVGDMRRLALSFEKKVTKNQEHRVKFIDQPTKFMESEVELHEEIEAMNVLATQPQYYEELIRLNTVSTMLTLLSHENTDIVIAVVGLLREMTDADVEENIDALLLLTDKLINGQVLTLLHQAIGRLDESEKEGIDGVHNILGILENMMEIKADISEIIADNIHFMPWLLRRIQADEFDNNKLYASELLAIVAQHSNSTKTKINEFSGIEIFLTVVSPYRRADPQSTEETEFMENVFDALCACVSFEGNRATLVNCQGVELMVYMLREKHLSQLGALKVLDHSMAGNAGAEVCAVFVDKLGLKSLFPAFMKTPEKVKKAGNSKEFEEHVASILASLLRNLKDDLTKARVLHKFMESDFAKIERLVELHISYKAAVEKVEQTQPIVAQELLKEGMGEDEVDLQQYSERLDAGLFTLQLLDFIISEVCLGCGEDAQDKVLRMFKMKGHLASLIGDILNEYADNAVAVDGSGADFADRLRELASYW